MVKAGNIIYSVNKFGSATPHIVFTIEEDMVYMISIHTGRFGNDRMCVDLDKISNNCFDEDEYFRWDDGNFHTPNEETKINRYCKKRWNK